MTLFKGKLNDNPVWIGTSAQLDEGIDKLASPQMVSQANISGPTATWD
jgi:hypothetical protein